MNNLIRLEEVCLFAASIVAFSFLPIPWWWFPVCLLLPDISMIGYLYNNTTGAYLYNFFHHRAIALAVVLAGYLLTNNWILFVGIILFAHSTMDRIFGYGLKYEKGFKFTHLGELK